MWVRPLVPPRALVPPRSGRSVRARCCAASGCCCFSRSNAVCGAVLLLLLASLRAAAASFCLRYAIRGVMTMRGVALALARLEERLGGRRWLLRIQLRKPRGASSLSSVPSR